MANERVIFEVLALGGHRSATELAGVTGLSKPTVGIALAELEELGLVEQVGRRTGSTGRAPRLFRVRAQAGGALAVDVGRQWVRAARVDLTGQVGAACALEATVVRRRPSSSRSCAWPPSWRAGRRATRPSRATRCSAAPASTTRPPT